MGNLKRKKSFQALMALGGWTEKEVVYEDIEQGSWVDAKVPELARRVSRLGQSLEVLELRADGSKSILEMRMREVMRRIAQAVESDGTRDVRLHHMSLHARDLRSMDPSYTLKAAHPGIVVRQHVILANFDPLKAVIVHDRMLVLLPKTPGALVDELCQQLRVATAIKDEDLYDSSSSLPFELRALEAVLAVATRRLTADCERLSPIATQAIELLQASRITLEQLERLRRLKNDVSYQETRARDTVEAIEATLNEDEDMCMMRLGHLREAPQKFEPPLSPEMLVEHEDVELLLENYLQHATATQTRLELLRLGIDNAEDLFSMRLDLARNRLIQADTILTVFSLLCAAGAFVAGFFGMNLHHQGPSFALVVAITMACLTLVAMAVFTALVRTDTLVL
ncbi:hypothetical protein CTAYLR_000132 [Chrysophaeum taylorii]|uniref:Magnesium transporter n=1 Tax=Chrysophaeum taylorii TaxID=2483200 RepID=A0AAD7UGN5_9STRA|nr:hypothetical protein CTAYLR_000132 [Chrysophaeum taylorii]